MPLPLLAGAAIGAGLGALSKGSKFKIDPYGGLNPEQVGVVKALGPRFSQMASQGPQYYDGQFIEPIGANEQAYLDRASRLNALQQTSLSNIVNQPENFDEQFASEIEQPTLDFFRREIQPQIEEELPTFSTSRASVVARNLANLTGSLAQQRFDARQRIRDQAISGSGALSEAIQTGHNIISVPRQLKQAGLDKAYTDFVTGNQQYGNYLNSMLNFIGIPTPTAQEETSIFDRILAGASSGAKIAGSLGGK